MFKKLRHKLRHKKMEQGNIGRSKFYWLIGFLLLVTLVILAFKYSMKTTNKSNVGDSNKIVVPDKRAVNKQELPVEALPEKFPADFPIEKDAVVEQNYNSISDVGNFQSTRSYRSAQSLEQNEKIFNDYFKKAGWKISATHKDTNVVAISAIKDSLNMIITINNVVEDKSVNVNITVVQAPKS